MRMKLHNGIMNAHRDRHGGARKHTGIHTDTDTHGHGHGVIVVSKFWARKWLKITK